MGILRCQEKGPNCLNKGRKKKPRGGGAGIAWKVYISFSKMSISEPYFKGSTGVKRLRNDALTRLLLMFLANCKTFYNLAGTLYGHLSWHPIQPRV